MPDVPAVPAPVTIENITARITRVLMDLEAIEQDLAHVPDMPPAAVRTMRDRLVQAAGSASLAAVGMTSWRSIQGVWRRVHS